MLKNIFITIVLSGLIIGAYAQDNQSEFKTIFPKNDGKKIAHGGYGSIGFGYTTIDSKSALLLNVKGAWVIDHKVALGFSGTGFMNNLEKTTQSNEYYLGGGYGGFFFEPIFFARSPIHFSVPILVGGGGVSTMPQNYWEDDYWNYQDYDAFFVFEPGVELEVNVVSFMRVGLGASYRFTNGILINPRYNDPVALNALDGYNFFLNLKFGKF
jgi:hypothetical protein